MLKYKDIPAGCEFLKNGNLCVKLCDGTSINLDNNSTAIYLDDSLVQLI